MSNHPSRGLRVAEIAAMLMNEAWWIQSSKDLRPPYYAVPSPEHAVKDAAELLRLGNGVSIRAVRYCNGEGRERLWENGRAYPKWDEQDDERRERADDRARLKAQEIADRYGAKVETGGDPRGFTLRLHLQSGRYNSFGGKESGWGIA